MNTINLKEEFTNLNTSLFCITLENTSYIYKAVDNNRNRYQVINLNTVFLNSFAVEEKEKEEVVFLNKIHFNETTLKDVFINLFTFEHLLDDLEIKDFDLNNKNTRLNIMTTAIGKVDESAFKKYTLEQALSWYNLFKEVFTYTLQKDVGKKII